MQPISRTWGPSPAAHAALLILAAAACLLHIVPRLTRLLAVVGMCKNIRTHGYVKKIRGMNVAGKKLILPGFISSV